MSVPVETKTVAVDCFISSIASAEIEKSASTTIMSNEPIALMAATKLSISSLPISMISSGFLAAE